MTPLSQFLVRFQNRTHVIQLRNHRDDDDEDDDDTQPPKERVLQQFLTETISTRTGWPVTRLEWQHWEYTTSRGDSRTDDCGNSDGPIVVHYVTLRLVSTVRGGKGGFGTLLKGQSRQAGANATTNFGACRDLQGRRLRHVNQAVEARIFHQWREQVQAGTATTADMAKALLNTNSGVVGWHLQLPAWADVSASQEQRKWKRKFYQWKREQDAVQAAAQEKRRAQEQQVQSYLEQVETARTVVQHNLQSALAAGLKQVAAAKAHKRAKVMEREEQLDDPPTALLTLAGDVTMARSDNNNNNNNSDEGVGGSSKWQMQTQSNFGTVGIILDQQQQLSSTTSLYYEIVVVTGGLVQVGWATMAFRPSSEAGDGVGDCVNSWAYDGSRRIRLHGTSSDAYGTTEWKAGTVVGCSYSTQTGDISFSLNGMDQGVAYTVPPPNKQESSSKQPAIYPAISLNPGEIVELHLYPNEFKHQPAGSIAVGDVLAKDDVSFLLADHQDESESSESETDTKEPANAKSSTVEPQPALPVGDKPLESSTTAATAEPAADGGLVIEPLDLDQYESVQELEKLGLDRLKGSLMAIHVKCGGTLRERAARLFSLKGLAPNDYPPKLRAKSSK